MNIIKLFVLMFFCCFLCGCSKQKDLTTIQFATWGSQSEIEILKPILNDFESQNPDIKVQLVHIPQNYFQKIHLLFASNLAPDVVFLNNLYLPVYANAGLLEERASLRGGEFVDDEAIQENITINYSDFYDKSLQSLSFNGKLYAIPRDISNLVVYYNKDIFHKYNVPVPNKYWTFDDLLKISQKLTKDTNGDGKTDIWGISFEETPPLYYLPYLMSEGGGILSDDAKQLIFDSSESQKGLNFYIDLRKKYHVAPTKAESASATMAQMFLDGTLAMQVSGRWLVPKYSTDAKFDWNVVNFPSGDKGSVVPLDASGWAVAKNSKHKKEALRLVEFLSSKKSIEQFSKSGLIVPARIDVAKGEFLQSRHGKNSPRYNKVFVDVIKTSKPTPVSVNYNEILDDINEKTNYIFN